MELPLASSVPLQRGGASGGCIATSRALALALTSPLPLHLIPCPSDPLLALLGLVPCLDASSRSPSRVSA
jgi:hypothetical protein